MKYFLLILIFFIVSCSPPDPGTEAWFKEKHKELLNLNPDERWNQVFQLASKIKRCGEATDDGCGCKQPN